MDVRLIHSFKFKLLKVLGLRRGLFITCKNLEYLFSLELTPSSKLLKGKISEKIIQDTCETTCELN